MSTLRSATGKVGMAFLLAAVLVVAGYATILVPRTVSAQEDPTAATPVPRENLPPGEAVVPASDEDATEQVVIAPAPDQAAQDSEQVAQEIPEDASGQEVIAPGSDAGEGESLIAPAGRGESGDDGESWWIYGLLAGVGLAAAAGTGTLAMRLRHRGA